MLVRLSPNGAIVIVRKRQHGATEVREIGLVAACRVRRDGLHHKRFDRQTVRLGEARPVGELSTGETNFNAL